MKHPQGHRPQRSTTTCFVHIAVIVLNRTSAAFIATARAISRFDPTLIVAVTA